ISAFDAARPASPAFGEAWREADSDWDALARWSAWRDALPPCLPTAYFERLSEGPPETRLANAMARLAPALAGLVEETRALGEELRLDLQEAFGAAAWEGVAASALAGRLAIWRGAEESITRYIAYAAKRRLVAAAGLSALADGAHAGDVGPDRLAEAFERAHLESVRDRLFAEWPELRAFDGVDQERLRAAFRAADLAAIGHARRRIAAAHARGLPSGEGGVGALGVLNGEIAKKRRHLPIRALLERAGPAIQRLKPVFLMSPLSVAQFLKPGALAFDLLVIDEASQVEPVDALGAVARCDQIVVVGDERQLPPTRFFAKLTSDLDDPDEGDEDEAAPLRAADVESILDLCLAKGAPYRMLNWHYRSRHQSLIAVSNREFYDGRLSIIPSPFAASEGVGLSLRHLPDTAYDRGGTRTNPEEARAVAEAVIHHARLRPDQSLGVATFSTAQRQAVMRALEGLRRDNPDVEPFFAADGPEPFFVKNLETIQGDERDVIFISVGYGKTREGYLSHSFGPLNGEGGERRLNVLISRAKVRCEVFANFTGDDVDLARSGARGVAALKSFLTFAQTGGFGQGTASGRGFDSPFEALVAQRLEAMGHRVEAQIGAAGFFIDLAVVDPDRPGRYLLGIE
ncbi:AAA domain-containing protein, partial [Phenylobacterium sp.]|uniref:AAA domain-containing protein n=1 Tax=Phenylobacterium sp. TaxID=1871053 RepID=UPI0019AC86B8